MIPHAPKSGMEFLNPGEKIKFAKLPGIRKVYFFKEEAKLKKLR